MTRMEALERVAEAGHAVLTAQTTPGANVSWHLLFDALRALDALPASPAGETVGRKIVQVSTAFDRGDGYGENGSSYQPAMVTTALCSDGTLWWKHHHESPWVMHQPIPTTVETEQ